MKYLAYHQNGFLKKFPLKKKRITLGRSNENDLAIDDTFLSRIHLHIDLNDDGIHLKDLDSANGTFFQSRRIKELNVVVGQTFTAGRTDITLGESEANEFTVTDRFEPAFKKEPAPQTITRGPLSDREPEAVTDTTRSVCGKLLKDLLKMSHGNTNFTECISYLSSQLSTLDNFGSLFLTWKPEDDPHILLCLENHPNAMDLFKTIIHQHQDLFNQPMMAAPFTPAGEERLVVYAFPFRMDEKEAALVYVPPAGRQKESRQIEKFLVTLCKEIELIVHICCEKEKESPSQPEGGAKEISSLMQTDGDNDNINDNIIAVNAEMKQMIQQAKRIAGSDLFVLVQGESGTGKELFARLIHNHSNRSKNDFVALNCAAIPEPLLESELFGYEKGAFTGAYAQRKGKLELASGGTLVLDEIGDMPINLQSKLLRALQEKEFYRLGGLTPITVDLRIISLTHQNLKQLIKEKSFRSDLYFRLVHRSLTIPPLRRRKEDIPVFINYFTNHFCRLADKTVMGYSVKAFDALLNYCWHGNVRELENEINSLVNLTDSGSIIDYDLLSEEVRNVEIGLEMETVPEANVSITSTNRVEIPPQVDPPPTQTDASETQRPRFYGRPNKETIIQYLEKNDWNKSQTARELNMTYQGLHKKMNRLGIQAKGKQLTKD